MSKNTKGKKDTKTTEVDPQTLFQQFSPALHFEEPKASTKDNWYIVAEQVVPVARDAFWGTIRRWTTEPQLVIPPIEKADIKSTTQIDADDHLGDFQGPIETIVRELIPKRKSKDPVLTEQVEYFENDKEGRVIYRPLLAEGSTLPFYYPKVKAYSFVYDSGLSEEFSEEKGTLRLEIIPCESSEAAVSDPKMQYALKAILHKLFKWCIQTRLGYTKKAQHDVLVSKETYQSMYQYIKSKYGPELVANWTEKTDPKKFVFEDLAIASYLLCLWKQEEAKTNRFGKHELGCGNGLLTFLLVSESYEGYGIDIADRKIWPALCKDKKDMLRVEALYPAQISYPNTEWLIGNHADELVPWIPIIASKSGVDCKFIVIPCCFYGLDGTKSLSLPQSETLGKYRAYTNYVKEIAVNQAGYVCEEDYLRIPSTKNIAIIGRSKQVISQPNRKLDKSIAIASESFIPRKTDREKEEERQELLKKPKLEK
ncbi:uncharacterized protein EV154DRAFT_562429 [Mucor mucedo]|uniref:uncharacterized protein n=1 Tax=Mucor mucedo TaxID=29922 RepID=UPI00222015D9|nr:uncharacterized protein EV154DRAFT_562429 [Mucor mucedo]KAI7892223.1 hypothetical protein EV154DRAFT_562429 [Mucor mucedo]